MPPPDASNFFLPLDSSKSAHPAHLCRSPKCHSSAAQPVDCSGRACAIDLRGNSPQTYSEDGSDCIVAVIDDGIDVLHQAFQDADGKTRILEIWDQTDDITGPSPIFTYIAGLQSHTAPYGTLHKQAKIDSYIQTERKDGRMIDIGFSLEYCALAFPGIDGGILTSLAYSLNQHDAHRLGA